MKGEKRKYSKAQVITMLTIAFLLVAGLSYGVVSVQNTFTPNSTISSSAVNANFKYLGDRMPAFRVVVGSTGYITYTTSPYQVLGQYTFTAPAEGYVKVRVSSTYNYCYRTDTTVSNYMYFGWGTYTTGFYNYGMSKVWLGDTGLYKYFNPTSEYYAYVSAGSSTTFYMMAFRDSTGLNSWYIGTPLMTIEYFPSLM